MTDFLPADDFETLVNAGATPAHVREDGVAAPTKVPCGKCGGTGSFRSYTGRTLGPCFGCKGTGKVAQRVYVHTAQERADRRAARRARKSRRADKWRKANPELATWMAANALKGNAFAASLENRLEQTGELTDNQVEAVRNALARDAARKEEALQRANDAPVADVARLEASFQSALSNGLERPRLKVADFVFSLAGANSRNPGAVYAKHDGVYVGKFMAGRFFAARECSPEVAAAAVLVAADPHKAAVAHGHRTGQCSCCGRKLTNQESVELGIGPICRDKWGW